MSLLPWSSPADFAARAVAFDVETHAGEKCQCPRCLVKPCWDLVLGSIADAHGGRLLNKEQTVRAFVALIRNPRLIIVGANIAFDMLVMARACAQRGINILPDIFAAYEAGRIYDVQIAEMLNAVADGTLGLDPFTRQRQKQVVDGKIKDAWYSLMLCVLFVLGRDDAKANDEYRLSYGLFDGVPLDELPEAARQYPVDDVRNTWDVAAGQVGHIPKRVAHEWVDVGPEGAPMLGCIKCHARPGTDAYCFAVRPHRNLHDLAAQVGTAWSLYLGAQWGFSVDGESVDALERDNLGDRAEALLRQQAAGYIRRDGTQDMGFTKRAVAAAYGATGACEVCGGTGKVPSPKNPKARIICKAACCGTGFADLGTTPRTEPTPTAPYGNVQTGRDALNESGDDGLIDLADFDEGSKLADTYLPFLRSGIGAPIILRPRVLLETGRVSYQGVIQLLPRKGGIRDCITARKRKLLCSVDYDSGELVTHGWSTLKIVGESALADALCAGIKPHSALGAQMIGASYEDFEARMKAKDPFAKDARQAAKPGNFGFPGGMGAAKLVLQQRKQGPDTVCAGGPALVDDGTGKLVAGYKGLRFCILMDGATRCGVVKVTSYRAGKREIPCPPTCARCIECAQRLREHWFATWPENRPYFGAVAQWVEEGMPLPDSLVGGPGVYGLLQVLNPNEIAQHRSWRIRGGVEFTAAANGFFQGLLADIAKAALRRAQRECYVRTRVQTPEHEGQQVSVYEGLESPLYGSRVILFAHDELIAEIPEDESHDAATRLSEVMVTEMRRYCPELAAAAKAEPALMRRWYKGAEPVKVDGKYVPWEPKPSAPAKVAA